MIYDLIIIGGGPAGLMAGCRAGELGAKVIILEKNKRAGLKLLTTGGGRCNFTNNIASPRILASNYEPNPNFLISAFSRFGPSETISFFNKQGIETKTENNNRVFPVSNRATDVLDALLRRFHEVGGRIKFNSGVTNIISREKEIIKVVSDSQEEFIAHNYLIATGGKSYSATGSNGEAYNWLEKMGHTIITPRPALVAIQLKDKFIYELEGLSLSGIKLSLLKNGKIIKSISGDIMFTQKGISGPAALDMSRFVEAKQAQIFSLIIDLKPNLNEKELIDYLQKAFHSGHKLFKNIAEKIIPPKFAPVLTTLLKINPEKQANTVTREEKLTMVKMLKNFPLAISSLGDFESAMVTGGGADLKELDPKTYKSKIISNLYLAGEILDLSGPTGGYNLQLCWSTGYIAGESAIDKNIHS